MGLFTNLKPADPAPAPEVPEVPADPAPAPEVPEVDPLTTTQKKLHSALVALDGRLANPEDLPFNADHLESDEALETAITAFLESHPTLKKNYIAGDVGQGTRGSDKKPVDLIELMRNA